LLLLVFSYKFLRWKWTNDGHRCCCIPSLYYSPERTSNKRLMLLIRLSCPLSCEIQ
jgi:hypothetical protein